jgi:sigma54-dependent transcription regulator
MGGDTEVESHFQMIAGTHGDAKSELSFAQIKEW